jgi:hypothetical protein
VVRLDVTDRPVQVSTAAKRSVDDEKVADGIDLGGSRVLLRSEPHREVHLDLRQAQLQGQRKLVQPWPFRRPSCVTAGTGDKVPGPHSRGEQAPLYEDLYDPGRSRRAVAHHQPGSQRRGDPRRRLRGTAVHPDSRVDPPHTVKEQHSLWQRQAGIGIERPPLICGHFQVEVELRG